MRTHSGSSCHSKDSSPHKSPLEFGMHVVWALEEPPSSFHSAIFLAGPTPRRDDVLTWRTEYLQKLEEHGYEGVVFIPEPRSGQRYSDYDSQVEWEAMGLRMADVIVFWVPRDLATLPGFTTNVEWGMWYDSGKAVFGAPESAPKNTYLRYYADRFGIPACTSIEETVIAAMAMIGVGAERSGGERDVPLFIWNRPEFQAWYHVQANAGHLLQGAELVWHFGGQRESPLFGWVLRVNMHLPQENRSKRGEFLITRLNASSVLAWNRAADLLESEIVLVREFRSAASSEDGYVWELPGGSSFESTEPLLQAAEELMEETGVRIESDRFRHTASRQSCATLLTHQTHLFEVLLSDSEIQKFRDQEGMIHGEHDSERCMVHVLTLRDILQHKSIDWAQLGMILSRCR